MTETQKRIYDFIKQYVADNGFAPSVREIQVALGYRSVSSVQGVINTLIKNGNLKRENNRIRTIRVVESFDTFEDRARFVAREIRRMLSENGMYISNISGHQYLCDVKSNEKIIV